MDIVRELLLAEEARLVDRLAQVRSQLGATSHDNIVSERADIYGGDKPRYSDLSKNNSIRNNTLEVLKRENRFLFKSEIVDILKDIHTDRPLDQVNSRVTAELSKAKKEIESLVNVNFGKSKTDFVWGRKDWLDTNGNILPAHAYVLPESKKRQPKLDF
ncbi:hypothetical protein [Flavobacterium sp. BFFFF1]|uniref:hypothetical protein n=1 Tax=Flavobacterium sp. BFFFF1 TaxID=2015557 RepID=UPI0025C0AE0D|nr:hypothetical protein [Flavobacterium sp. BFFFF1]